MLHIIWAREAGSLITDMRRFLVFIQVSCAHQKVLVRTRKFPMHGRNVYVILSFPMSLYGLRRKQPSAEAEKDTVKTKIVNCALVR